jgi:hypothetical protein
MTPDELAAVEARISGNNFAGITRLEAQQLCTEVRRLTAENVGLRAQLGVTAHFLEYVADGMRTEARELDATDKAHLATGMLARAAIWDETRLEIVALLRAMP